MKNRSYFTGALVALACAALASFLLVVRHEVKAASAPDQSGHVFVAFEGVWAFAQDPTDANSILAFAPKTDGHHELSVQDEMLGPGVYELSMPARTGPATATVDPNIIQARIDTQHALSNRMARYAIRLPKPEAYIAASHSRIRVGSAYPPAASTEKEYVTSVSLRYTVATLSGFSLAGSPDSGIFKPLSLRMDNPTLTFLAGPAGDPDADNSCHTHERQAFRDLTKLVNVTMFLDFPEDASTCRAQDPQNPRPVKSEIAPSSPSFFVRGSAGGPNQHLLAAAFYFFGVRANCMAPIIVSGG
jgi:hypothetical protein